MHHPTDRITHTTAFVIPVMEHWLEREIAQWVNPQMLACGVRPPKLIIVFSFAVARCNFMVGHPLME